MQPATEGGMPNPIHQIENFTRNSEQIRSLQTVPKTIQSICYRHTKIILEVDIYPISVKDISIIYLHIQYHTQQR